MSKKIWAVASAFGDFRVRPNREFFKMDPYKVKAILEVLALEDVTPKNEIVASAEDSQALVVICPWSVTKDLG